MPSSRDLSFSRTLPSNVFDQLGEFLQQMAQQAVGKAALVLTEAVLIPIDLPQEWQTQRFTVVVSEQFSALLVGSPEEQGKQGTLLSRGATEQGSRGATEQGSKGSRLLTQHLAMPLTTMGTPTDSCRLLTLSRQTCPQGWLLNGNQRRRKSLQHLMCN